MGMQGTLMHGARDYIEHESLGNTDLYKNPFFLSIMLANLERVSEI